MFHTVIQDGICIFSVSSRHPPCTFPLTLYHPITSECHPSLLYFPVTLPPSHYLLSIEDPCRLLPLRIPHVHFRGSSTSTFRSGTKLRSVASHPSSRIRYTLKTPSEFLKFSPGWSIMYLTITGGELNSFGTRKLTPFHRMFLVSISRFDVSGNIFQSSMSRTINGTEEILECLVSNLHPKLVLCSHDRLGNLLNNHH